MPRPLAGASRQHSAGAGRAASRSGRMSALGGVVQRVHAVAPQPVREIAPATLRGHAPATGPEPSAWMTDRISATLWSTGRPQRGGEWIHVDLGAVVPVALHSAGCPAPIQEVPRGVRLEALGRRRSRGGRLVELPEYLGPLYWSAGPADGARAERPGGAARAAGPDSLPPRHADRASTRSGTWTIRELHVYARRRAGRRSRRSRRMGRRSRGRIGAAGVRTLYADHGWASRVAAGRSRDPRPAGQPASWTTTASRARPAMLLPPVRWEPGTGRPAGAEPTPRASPRLAESGGLAFTTARARRARAVRPCRRRPRRGRRFPAAALGVTASRHAERAAPRRRRGPGDALGHRRAARAPATGFASIFGRPA